MSDRSFIARHRRGALKGVSLPRDAGFAVTAAPDAARFVLRGNPAAVVAFGIAPPERLQASAEGNRAAFWLGPDEFLLFAPGEDADIVRSSLEAGLTGEPHSLVDVSSRQIGLVLEGKRAARCLSAGCPLDLRPAAFPVGMVARTIFLKTEIVLWRRSAEQFHVEVWRSFAPYLVGHLAEAYAGTHGLSEQFVLIRQQFCFSGGATLQAEGGDERTPWYGRAGFQTGRPPPGNPKGGDEF